MEQYLSYLARRKQHRLVWEDKSRIIAVLMDQMDRKVMRIAVEPLRGWEKSAEGLAILKEAMYHWCRK